MPSPTEVGPGAVVVNLCFALVIAAVVVETVWWAFVHGRERLRSTATAAAMGAGAAITGVAVAAAQVWLWEVLGGAAPSTLAHWWSSHPALGAVAAFVAWDAAGYWYHRVGHRTRIGWASHQVHHSGEHYDLSLAWRQPWLPLHALAVFPLVALGGFDVATVLVCAAVSNLYQALLHLARPVATPRWVTALVQVPATHRRHHLREGPAVNLGPVLTLWDRLWGTWDPTPVPTDARFGLHAAAGANPIAVQAAGWRSLLGPGKAR